MSTGSGYDMILLSIKGPGGARVAPTRMRAPRRPHHHASLPKKRRGQHHRRPSASPRSTVRAIDSPSHHGHDGAAPRGSHDDEK